jgi:hypothetical protein
MSVTTPHEQIIREIIGLALAHVSDRVAFSGDLEHYFLTHQDDWRWDGVSWDGPYRQWELRPCRSI